MASIDQLTKDQVYQDPIKSIQQEQLQELTTLREGIYSALLEALSQIERPGAAAQSSGAQ